MKCWTLALSIFVGSCCALSAYTVEGLDVDIHGSLSQTYLHTSDHEFLITGSHKGTFEYTEASLNAFKQFENWSLGAQVISRDFGEEGDFDLRLDWGYVEVALSEIHSLKAGAVKLPIGLYSEFRDVDAARMEVLYPQIFNPEDFRDAAEAYEGVGLEGDWGIGEKQLLHYHFFWGRNEIHDDFFLVRQTQNTYQVLTGLNQEEMSLDSHQLWGGQVIWMWEPLQWRLGYNYIHFEGDFNIRHPDALNPGSTLMDAEGLGLDIDWHILSTDLQRGAWGFSAELLIRKNKYHHGAQMFSRFLSPLAGLNSTFVNGDEQRNAYATLRYQVDERTGAFLSYGQLRVDQDPRSLEADRLKELGIGVRYDFNDHLLGKIQGVQYWGHHGTLDGSVNRDQRWAMFLTRLTAHF